LINLKKREGYSKIKKRRITMDERHVGLEVDGERVTKVKESSCCSKKHDSEQPTVPELCSDLSSLCCGVRINIMVEAIAFFLGKLFNEQADKIKGIDDPISCEIELFTEMLTHHCNEIQKQYKEQD